MSTPSPFVRFAACMATTALVAPVRARTVTATRLARPLVITGALTAVGLRATMDERPLWQTVLAAATLGGMYGFADLRYGQEVTVRRLPWRMTLPLAATSAALTTAVMWRDLPALPSDSAWVREGAWTVTIERTAPL